VIEYKPGTEEGHHSSLITGEHALAYPSSFGEAKCMLLGSFGPMRGNDCREPNGSTVSSGICADYYAEGAGEWLRPVHRMARRFAPPPNSRPLVLTLEQKRYRIERFQVCIKRLEDFDPAKVQRRVGVPEIVTLEASIDNALSATFGYGTRSYFRFNLAARLDVGPLVTGTALEGTVLRSVAGPGSRDEWAVQEAQRYFSEGKARSIGLLREGARRLR
jgi:hypothetical protein